MLDQSALCLQTLGKVHMASGTPVASRGVWLELLESAARAASGLSDAAARKGCFRSIEKTLAALEAEYAGLPHMRHAAA